MARRTPAIALFLCLCPLIFGGDIATFVNLGFSQDSRYFMFGQYGVREEGSVPYADVFLVDVQANNFVPAGVRNAIYREYGGTRSDGKGALFTLVEEVQHLVQKSEINHLLVGRLLYILINNEEAKQKISFRDFETGRRYDISLVQSAQGSGKAAQSAFHLEVQVGDESGNLQKHTVGLPSYMRSGVKGYRIKQVILAPDARSIVFVIEKDEISSTGSEVGIDVRYMVETVKAK